MNHFYTDLVDIQMLTIELDMLDISPDEKEHLIKVAKDTLHHAILDLILSELSEEDKIIFLRNHSENQHDKVWEHLKTKVDNIESKIKSTVESLKKELHSDIKSLN